MPSMTDMNLRIACRNCSHRGAHRRHCYIRPRLIWSSSEATAEGSNPLKLLAHCPHCFRFLGCVDAAKWGPFAANDRPVPDEAA